ncbi:MAG: M15 family metallopeptidase, partial [Actinomycetota bacterium]
AWSAANLPAAKETYPTRIVALCHKAIHNDLAAALQEVKDTLPSLITYTTNPYFTGIDVINTINDGGCATGSSARLSRIANGTGTVSRHSWGQAIDMSTAANCQGCVPKMDCRIVRIFRKHGFAWGGNFLEPDGMHFEWVGEARNLNQTPVAYCPNLPSGQIQSTQKPPPTNRENLFADDGWSGD